LSVGDIVNGNDFIMQLSNVISIILLN